MGRMIPMVGRKFGCFEVLHESSRRSGSGQAYWWCRCDCGRGVVHEVEVLGRSLRGGVSKSCGQCTSIGGNKRVFRGDRDRHGQSQTPTYKSWKAMKERTTNPNHVAYAEYGGRGIKLYTPWLHFENFFADMGHRPKGMTLDRKDHNGDYTPENCQWTTVSRQNLNRRRSRQSSFVQALLALKKDD